MAADPVPTAVSCMDAPQLRQRAVGDRREIEKLKSDQARVVNGSRAGFLASLAIIADLKCRVISADADEALRPAFEAARRAEASDSFYERARMWGEASFIATQVIALLIRDLPAAPSK
ncbi:MAG TPA: hypothetical protein VFI87_07280 [Hyphomicrobiaceae bacterium]|nr:hypothetical protein [Hyphomicrobiaceae bacterium]